MVAKTLFSLFGRHTLPQPCREPLVSDPLSSPPKLAKVEFNIQHFLRVGQNGTGTNRNWPK